MSFKKLELYGFKSFADKLEIRFEPGITGIVGPNGCGKSNVADAVRWVLGEQSAKSLRGKAMQDVIFSGTSARKSLSYCEVNLHFDNRDKLFPMEFEEIVLSRKLYRSGESEYAINRSPCRLKDITDILHDAGLGREGYSIIGQGRIDEILSAKPDDRRAIFEEAAGIAKFKHKRLETERKLMRTRENISRLNDIVVEVERQLGPLVKQAENAKIFLELKESLKHFEVNTYLYQYDSASNAKASINERMKAVDEEIAVKQASYEKAVADYTEFMNEINSMDKAIESHRDEILELTVGLEKIAGEHKLLVEKLKFMREQDEKSAEEGRRLETALASYRASLAEAEEAYGIREKFLVTVRKEAADVNDRYITVVDKLAEGEGELDRSQKEIMAALERLTDVKSNLSRLTAEKTALDERAADLARRAESVKLKITDDEIRAILSGEEIAKLEAKRADLQAQADDAARKCGENASLAGEAELAYERAYAASVAVSERLKVLKDTEAAGEGYGGGARQLLKDASAAPALSSRIEGTVARLLSAPKRYEAAIEAALGESVQNIVTRSEEDARFLLDYLKQKKHGRAVFMPLSRIKTRELERGHAKLIHKYPGVIGPASDIVECQSKYASVARALLGSTVIVEDLNVALELARRSDYGFKIVTLDGEVIDRRGALAGGVKAQSALLGRDREIKELEVETVKQKAELAGLSEKRAALTAGRDALTAALKRAEADVHSKEVALAAETEKRDTIRADVESSKKEAEVLRGEREITLKRAAEIDNEIKSVDELEALIKSKKKTADSGLGARQKEFEALRTERDALHEKLTSLKISLAGGESGLSASKNDIERMRNDIEETRARIDENNAQAEKNKATIDAAAAAAERQRGQTEGDAGRTRLDELKGKLGDLDAYKAGLQNKLSAVDGERLSLMNELQKLTDKKYKEETLLAKVDTDIEIMQNRIIEEYNLSYEACETYRDREYDVQAGIAETNKLKRRVQALGFVNVNAIEESRELSARYTEMTTQRDDLSRAEEDLNKIIAELTAQMVTDFKTAFDAIKENFTKIFRELFGGGRAELSLSEDGGLLEAGIDIVAEPPGKKLQSISLLSGGERALTAIAILFSILRLRPMPFCILDEIEAALDDANAERFAKYLHRFSQETQFIVITHRKPTMELADSLYGVTMEEKGVSKMVSVKLTDALKAAG